MKPFNLKQAQAGKPIIFRDNTPVKFIGYIPEANEYCQIIVMHHGNISTANIKGKWTSYESPCDLFMAPEKKIAWVNIYPNCLAYHYETKEEADDKKADNRIACIKIEYDIYP